MGNSISPHIENARKTGVCSLSDKGLKELPPEFSSLAKVLRTADLSNNRLQVLPPVIGQFSSLKSLNVDHNRLETVPSELESLTKLDTLSLEGNRISSIPQSIFPKLKSLKSVSLAGNRLTVFPIEICQLQNLDAVDLSSNRIDSIPDSLESLKAIELNLNSNRLNVLPSSLAKCERLKVLRVQENCLSLDSITTEILKDSQISLLACEGNLFEMKAMHDKDGYDEYMKRYTATKKKFI